MTVKRLILEIESRREWAIQNLYASTMKREFNAGVVSQTDLEEIDAEIDSYSRAEQFYNDMLFEIDCILKGGVDNAE